MPVRKKSLLIVDDDPLVRGALSQVFEQTGYCVRMAADGFTALAQMREAVPDVLVSDLNMPGMSGFELLSVVRRRRPAVYVIATSGAYSGTDVPAGIAADAFYEKASGLRRLLQLVAASTRTETPDRRHAAPLWIPRVGAEGAEETYGMISCPECLRAQAQPLDKNSGTVCDTVCPDCATPIRYAVVKKLDPLTAQPYDWKSTASVVSEQVGRMATGQGQPSAARWRPFS